MPQIDVYTSMMCGYCTVAKNLLKKRNANFKEIDVGMNPAGRQEMMSRSGGQSSVPQIFIGDVHVGGCDDLIELDRSGELEPLLKA